ncbi:hypothetical protein A6P39_029815 [Streptomyces sp. FXJ1.172]|uniref:hypothetical protein n=1 Tax=Streptomyces sp. FXJ1.172 TaxID=710705 RepID=UPI0007CFFB83
MAHRAHRWRTADDGVAPVAAITAQVKSEGVPYTTVKPADSARPAITPAFLAGTAEQTALEMYERTYGIPQPDAYTWAHPGLPAHPRLVWALLGKATVHR